jgi:hypothetical protein
MLIGEGSAQALRRPIGVGMGCRIAVRAGTTSKSLEARGLIEQRTIPSWSVEIPVYVLTDSGRSLAIKLSARMKEVRNAI